MVWREPVDHLSDCYFCAVNTQGISNKNRKLITYPNLKSAIRPVPFMKDKARPIPSKHLKLETSLLVDEEVDSDTSYIDESVCVSPHLITELEPDSLIRDLQLTKDKSELLASRLQQWNLVGIQNNSVTLSFKKPIAIVIFQMPRTSLLLLGCRRTVFIIRY